MIVRNMQDVIDKHSGDFVKIEYIDPRAYPHQVSTVTKATLKYKDANFPHYGNRQHGDKFMVHKDDQKAAPTRFKLLVDEKVVAASTDTKSTSSKK